MYATIYDSPIGKLLLYADGSALTGVLFEGETLKRQSIEGVRSLWVRHGDADVSVCTDRTERQGYEGFFIEAESAILTETKRWLDRYFSGKAPGMLPSIRIEGTTFQREVLTLLLDIPYGETTTYGALAQRIAATRGVSRMSARAVGGAVGRNEIAVLVPCHRVIGADGSLTGYSGGLEKKIALLRLEGIDLGGRTK